MLLLLHVYCPAIVIAVLDPTASFEDLMLRKLQEEVSHLMALVEHLTISCMTFDCIAVVVFHIMLCPVYW